jgi:hypothetical protein
LIENSLLQILLLFSTASPFSIMNRILIYTQIPPPLHVLTYIHYMHFFKILIFFINEANSLFPFTLAHNLIRLMSIMKWAFICKFHKETLTYSRTYLGVVVHVCATLRAHVKMNQNNSRSVPNFWLESSQIWSS